MSGWRTSLVVKGHGVRGKTVPVVTGLVETAAGDLQIGLRVGEQGETAILPVQAASQLEVNLREVVAARLKVTTERLGGDEP